MRIINKKAKFNYQLLEKYEAGISLLGAEVKAVKKGNVDLSRSYAKVIGDEAYLLNANIAVIGKKDYDPKRSRKLLMHKSQITTIQTKIKAKKLTLVPVVMYTRGRLVKLEIALAKAKRKFEKREAIKKKEIEREIEAGLKSRAQNLKS
jgi:SsrA-binding protein